MLWIQEINKSFRLVDDSPRDTSHPREIDPFFGIPWLGCRLHGDLIFFPIISPSNCRYPLRLRLWLYLLQQGRDFGYHFYEEMPNWHQLMDRKIKHAETLLIISVNYNCLTVSECKLCMVSVECIENHPTIQWITLNSAIYFFKYQRTFLVIQVGTLMTVPAHSKPSYMGA